MRANSAFSSICKFKIPSCVTAQPRGQGLAGEEERPGRGRRFCSEWQTRVAKGQPRSTGCSRGQRGDWAHLQRGGGRPRTRPDDDRCRTAHHFGDLILRREL